VKSHLMCCILFFLLILVVNSAYAMETFRFPLPELYGRHKVPYNVHANRKIGVFRNLSTFRIELSGLSTPVEQSLPLSPQPDRLPNGKPAPEKQLNTALYPPSVRFILHPQCVAYYDQPSLEPSPITPLPNGNFHVEYYFIKENNISMTFLSEGDGSFTISMNLFSSAPEYFNPIKVDRIQDAYVNIAEATLVIEAEERIGDERPRMSDPFRLPVVFSVGYTNCAWGYEDNGFLIDADGNVFLYDNECRGPRYRRGNEPLTDRLMQNSFTMTKFVKHIKPKEFQKMKQLIPAAAKGSISQRRKAYDAGSFGFKAYLYDRESGNYTSILISKKGDYETRNDAPASDVLLEWLSRLYKEVAARKAIH